MEAVYVVVDEAADRFYQALDPSVARPACEAGCCTCCMQEVGMSWLEGELIAQKLQLVGGWQEIVKTAIAQWQAYMDETGSDGLPSKKQGDTVVAADYWDSKPCPLLCGGRCLLYGVRPLVCRKYMSKVRCTPSNRGEAEFRNLLSDQTAQQFVIRVVESMGRPWEVYTLRGFLYHYYVERPGG